MTDGQRRSDEDRQHSRSHQTPPPHRSLRTPLPLAVVLAALLVLVATALAPPALALTGEATQVGAGTSEPLRVLASPVAGSGRWYWPVGSETFGTMSGWLDPRGGSYHVGQDMPARYGQAVYAVGAGTVFKAKADADGYGPGGGPGGVMIIIHTTATGERFRALYGHIQGLRYKDGDRVAAGAVIATINGCSPTHLHFGIHLGSYYPDGNPYRGHVPMSWSDYGGWVDPVKYLKTHPRVIPYAAPALPATRIVTTSAPSEMGAADGVAYWTEQAETGASRWACELATGDRRQLADDEAVPAFDTVRYAITPLTPPELGFTVKDQLPILGVSPTHLTPRWRALVALAGRLTNAAGRPFAGARVRLERRSGTGWLRLTGTVSTSDGRVVLRWIPPRRTTVRLRFTPPSGARPAYLGARSATLNVAPHVRLTVPAAPASVPRNRVFTVTGYLTPQHPEGRGGVLLEFQRYADGSWTTALTTAAIVRDDGVRSHYGRSHSLATAGAWRVRAVHPVDAAHAATYSGWRRFTVD